MSNNLYGGVLYPNSSFHIDKIYNSLADANVNASNDGILVGRYVLIAYTKRPFSQKQKTTIHALIGPDNSISENAYKILDSEEKSYVNNLIKDIEDYDRILCRKAYGIVNNGEAAQNENSNFYYEPIANLSTTFDLTDQDNNNTFLQAFEEIVNKFNDIDKDLDLDLKQSEYYQNLFTKDWTMAPIRNSEGEIIEYEEFPTPKEGEIGIIQKAEEKETALQSIIASATNQNNTLSETIQNAETKDEELGITIQNAETKDEELGITIQNAETKDEELGITITTAEETKNNLDKTIEQAEGITTAFYWKPFPVKEEA